MSKPTLILGAFLWAAVLGGLLLLWQGRQTEADAGQANSGQEPDAGTSAEAPITPGRSNATVKLSFPSRKLPDFEFNEVSGGKIGLADLKGKRWVASFVFSRCVLTCPTITAAVMRLHERVEKDAPEVVFVTFTVDPRYDTVEVFREYSETFTKGKRDRWKFVTGSQQEIYELIVKGFGLYVAENLGKTRLPGVEVAHSNRVVLVNEEGIPVGTFLGTSEPDMVKLRRILTGQSEFPQPGPGLTFSTTDGTPLQIDFQVKPVDSAEQTSAPGASDQTGESDETSTPKKQADDARLDATDASSGSDAEGEVRAAGQQNPSASRQRSAAEHNAAIDSKLPEWVKPLPTVNASLNTLSAILLLAGLMAIKGQKKDLHRNLMITAFLTSAVFLGCYLTYHYALGRYTNEHGRQFSGAGMAALIYQLILWPHIILAVFVPILAIRVFQHAFSERWESHKRLARITFPIWMFVSVTGVVIYGMLYHWPWPAATAQAAI